MDREDILNAIGSALTAVREPHFHEDERGFQGEFYAELRRSLGQIVVPEGALLRQEYQKSMNTHGLKIRPDIILHEPFNPARHQGRDAGNHAVIELKRRARGADADQAFKNLIGMIDTLRYSLGVFINIDAVETFSERIRPNYRGSIVCFAVSLGETGNPRVIQA